MTTIRRVAVKCPECGVVFSGNTAVSYGSAGMDEVFCKKFWGYNPMPTFVKRCPSCDFVAFTGGFQMVEMPKEDCPREKESCDNYELFAERMEKVGERLERVGMIYHMGACCKKLEKEDPSALFAKALEMFKRARESGVEKVGEVEIDVLIEKLSK